MNFKPYLFRYSKSLLLIMIALLTWQFTAAQSKISGQVTSNEGEPLIGANILVKGTSSGTVTDFDGKYSLDVPSDATALMFSYTGYSPQEVAINGRSIIDVVLAMNTELLDEVVVVGYGTQKKVNLTGAVDMVTSEDLGERPVPNVAQAIQGASPNLVITTTNQGGEPGATQAWNIRGATTLTGGGDPYILVDGVPMNIDQVNPNDIESVSILKDAAASAIYGARAPYGVILITTKRGKADEKLSVTYSNNFAWSTPTNLPKAANSLEAANAMNYASENAGSAPMFTDETLGRIQDYLDGKITTQTIEDPDNENRWAHWNKGNANNDWMDIYFADWTPRQKHDLSLRGGTENTSFYISTGFFDQEGQLDWGDEYFKRYNITANISTKPTDWLTLNFRPKFARSETQYPNAWAGYDRTVIWHNFTRNWPMNPLYYPNDEISVTSSLDLLTQAGNQLLKENDLWMTLGTVIEPIKGWKTDIEYSYNKADYTQAKHKRTTYGTYPDGTQYIRNNPINEYTEWFQDNNYNIFHAITSYEHSLGNHNFKVLAGYEQEYNYRAGLWATKKALVTDNVPSISTATGDAQVDDWISHWATQGLFFRLNYNFNEKYLLEFNVRRDGTSRFENADTKWGTFPSGSVGWNISRETFWDPFSDLVNTMKLRASWGSLGNQNVANYKYIELIPVRTNLGWIMNGERPVYTGAPGLISPFLTWETATTIDFGFDAGLLNNRLQVTFDWYNRTTYDMFGPTEALPSVLGTSPPQENNATLETKGFEVILGWRETVSPKLSYNVKLVLGDNISTVKEYNNPTNILSNWYEGERIGDIWGYESAGLFQSDAEAEGWADQSALHARWQAGDTKYVDLNGDGVIDWGENTVDNPGDLKIIGNSRARFNYGITAGINFHNFDLNMFWQGIGKRDISFSRYTNVFFGFRGNKWQNSYYEQHMDYWNPDNPGAYYPRPYITGEHLKNTRTQTRFLQNGAYVRLKNVQLGYTLPINLTEKIFIQKARIYFSGENLLTFTKLTELFDPEATSGNWGGGKIYPLGKVLSMGVNVTF